MADGFTNAFIKLVFGFAPILHGSCAKLPTRVTHEILNRYLGGLLQAAVFPLLYILKLVLS